MSNWNAKYTNDNGEYEITFASKEKAKTVAVERLCKAIIDNKVESAHDVMIKEEVERALEWLKGYVTMDTKMVYSNGTLFVPLFRVEQAFKDKAYNGFYEGC